MSNNLFRSQHERDEVELSIREAVDKFNSVEEFEQYLEDTYDNDEYMKLSPRQKELRKYCQGAIKRRLGLKVNGYLMVTRDDDEYDTKSDFESYSEANKYRQECQRRWMGHCDYIYHIYIDNDGVQHKVNLTDMNSTELKEHLNKYNITY